MNNKSLIGQVEAQSPNRRGFLQKIGMASAALAGSAAVAQTTGGGSGGGAGTITDVDILQFALNLEYLEAEFYTYATAGVGIDQYSSSTESPIAITGSGNAGATSGGFAVRFRGEVVLTGAVAQEIAADERAHVRLIRSALTAAGIQPIAKPAIALDALGIGFRTQEEFLVLARAFEDVGVSAYGAAAPLITDKTILGIAARILVAEAEHTGSIRTQIARLRIPTAPALDGLDILPAPSGNRIFSLDANGLSAVRTPGQVLALVYADTRGGATRGGFFPNGVNGSINTSSAPAAAPTTTR